VARSLRGNRARRRPAQEPHVRNDAEERRGCSATASATTFREGKCKLENGCGDDELRAFGQSAAQCGSTRSTKTDKIDTVITTKDNRIDFGSPKEIKAKLADKIGLQLVVVTHGGQKFEAAFRRLSTTCCCSKSARPFSAVPYDQIESISMSGFPIRVKVATKTRTRSYTQFRLSAGRHPLGSRATSSTWPAAKPCFRFARPCRTYGEARQERRSLRSRVAVRRNRGVPDMMAMIGEPGAMSGAAMGGFGGGRFGR